MTFQPPPPPPPQGPPGGPPPPPQGPPPGGPPPQGPPPGQWGPPPGQPGPGRGGFDPKTVNQLDWGIIGAGVLAFLFSFIAFYSGVDVDGPGGQSVTVDGTASAWNDVVGGGFFAWFAMLFAVLGAAVIAIELFAPHVKLPLPFPNRLVSLALFAAATLFEIIALFVTPGDSYAGYDASANHGFGYWVSLIVIIAGLVLSFMRFQQTGGVLPIGNKGPGGPGLTPPPGPPR